jgi:hypothetical protein
MTEQKNKDELNKALEVLENFLPGITETLVKLEKDKPDESGIEILLKMHQETEKFKKEYPMLAELFTDTLEHMRVLEHRIEILKEILIASGAGKELLAPPMPVDKKWIN